MGEHPSGSSVTHATTDGIPAQAGWRGWAVGTRVVVRRRLATGGYGDVLGDLLEVGPDGVVVRTRRGHVRVAAADIALGKPVPPPPVRRAPGATAGEADRDRAAGDDGPAPGVAPEPGHDGTRD